MTVLCCCASPRSSKSLTTARREPKDKHPALPTPPPPARLPGPLTLNPVVPPSPQVSPTSMSSLYSSSVPNPLAPVESVELGQLVIDDSDSDGELEPSHHGKSTSALHLVRTRIRRHLSQEALPRRKGRSAVGTSQEEIDRRAELKRLMHKRIQQELQNDDAETVPSEGSSSQRPAVQAIDLPGGGPRDNLEFSVVEDTSQLESKNCTDNDESDPGPAQIIKTSLAYDENNYPDGRRASCPECNSPGAESRKVLRERSSLPQMPSSPDLLPKRFTSTSSSSSIGSWRLSYSAGQLDELLNEIDRDISENPTSVHLLPNSPALRSSTSKSPRLPFSSNSRSLSRSLTSHSHHGTPSNDDSSVMDQSPLGTWLRSQGLRSRSPSFSFIRSSEQLNDPEGSVQKAEVVYLKRCGSVQNCTVTEAEIPRPEVVHLYDMDIHGQLVTRALNTPDPSPTQSDSDKNILCLQPNSKVHCDKDNVQQHRVLGDLPENQCDDSKAGTGGQNGAATKPSSVYPSTSNSHNSSLGPSSLHLSDPSAHWKNSLALLAPGSMWLGDPYKPHGDLIHKTTSYPTTGENSSEDPAGYTQIKASLPLPTTEPSPPQEDRKSEIVEKSIHHFRLGHGATAMIVKRFHKRAEDRSVSSDSPKPSLLARLHLAFPKRAKLGPRTFDGASSTDQRQLESYSLNLATFGGATRPSSRNSNRSCQSPRSPRASGSSEDSTAELWQRAVHQEARNRRSALGESDSHHRRLSLPSNVLPRKAQEETETVSLGNHCSSTLGTNDAHPYGVGPESYPATPVSLLPVDRANTPRPDKPALPRDKGNRADSGSSSFPDAWARFPSHNRAERNGPAGQSDQVVFKDFAVQKAPNSGSNASSPTQQAVKREPQSSMPVRLGKAVKSGLSKLIPSKSSPTPTSPKLSRRRLHSDHGQPRNNLEYPELELLPAPGGQREINALRHEVQHLKEGPQVQYPVPLQQNAGPSGNKVALNVKMATLLHTDGASETDLSVTSGWASPSIHLLPGKPGHLDAERVQRRALSTTTTTGATDRFHTPLSSISMGNSNENISSPSFHSVLQSSPVSRAVRSPFPYTVADMSRLSEPHRSTESILSVKSDTAMSMVRKIQRRFLALSSGSNPTCTGDESASESNGIPKYGTWSGGQSKTHPVLAVAVAHTTTPEREHHVGRGMAARLWQSSFSLGTKVVAH